VDKPNPNLPSVGESARFHIVFGWWSLLVFLSLGIALEAFHGFKFGWYLGEDNYEVRRVMWRLAHAHGTALSLVHIVTGLAAHARQAAFAGWCRLASPLMVGAGILLPSGFFLGGVHPVRGQPGIGIYLVPVGALFLFLSILSAAINGMRRPASA